MPFLRNVPGLEAVYRDYGNKGVNFVIVYKSIVHPGTNGYVDALTVDERLRQLEVAKQRLGTTVPIVSDSLDGAIVKALKAAPNCEFVLDAKGIVQSRKFWHDPKALRAILADQFGPVDPPTRVEDLGMQLVFPERGAPRGKVAPIKVPDRMTIVQTQPVVADDEAARKAQQPFFAKLVAEADQQLIGEGKGKLYLGFYLDPVYGVHWNNPAGGLRYRIDASEGEAEAIHGQTPKYAHDADVDPREFLIPFSAEKDARFTITVNYTVCDDAGRFCTPIEQQYTLTMKRSRGPSRAGVWMTELVGDPMQYDKNGDGVVTRAELPERRAQIILLHHDRNHDDAISKAEAALFHDMIRIPQQAKPKGSGGAGK